MDRKHKGITESELAPTHMPAEGGMHKGGMHGGGTTPDERSIEACRSGTINADERSIEACRGGDETSRSRNKAGNAF